MKKILLSMKPYWRDRIMSGEKIYEYRTRFVKDDVVAFLYVSKPVQAISGILYLGEKIYLHEWKELYQDHEEIMSRIEDYESRGNKVAMPIKAYQETNEIPLKLVKSCVKDFVIPQSYIYIKEGSELEKFLEDKIELREKIWNCIEESYVDEICKKYAK